MITPNSPAHIAQPMARLINELHKLPGIGPKSAQRLAYHLIRSSDEECQSLAQAILDLQERISFCSICQDITETEPCFVCQSDQRNRTQICVVEEPMDILVLEHAKCFDGLYHVLHGVISPMNGIGPDNLKVRELLARLHDGEVQEVVLATNPTLEGEATAMYLQRLLDPLGIRITRLARGLPSGGDLEYADEVTLTKAFEGRQEF